MTTSLIPRFAVATMVAMVAVLTALLVAMPTAHALVGAHSYTNSTTGDVFLGGDYIEVGISKYGSFGTATGQPKPPGFYGSGGRNNVGMSSNAAGFGEAPDTRIDYFLPGNPEERWIVGYKQGGTPTTASNAFLNGSMGIANYTVTNQSSGDQLKSTGNGSLNSKLEITQVVSFNRADKFFKNVVTLKNIDSSNLDSVRFMRSFDPDNTRDQNGTSATHNEVQYTHAAGDGKAVVVGDTSNNPNDPVFLINGSRSPILFYSKDTRAKVSVFGFSNTDPYAASAYDSAQPKGYSVNADQAITITVDVGTLTPGASSDFTYYTSLDNRDIDEVIESIDESVDDGDNIDTPTESAAPNSGDGNGDGTADSQQANVTSLPNPVVGGGAYQTLETTGCPTVSNLSVKSASELGNDGLHTYPLGLSDFTITCGAPGDSTDITVYYDKLYDTTNWKARKYIGGSFINLTGATFGIATVGASSVTTLNYSVTDGGAFDADGVANGTIVDPAGPAVPLGTTLTATSLPGAPATGTGIEGNRSQAAVFIAILAVLMLGSQFVPTRFYRAVPQWLKNS